MPRTKKPKVHPDQEELPGAEQSEKLPDVIRAAKQYVKDRNVRIAANKEEKQSKDRLIAVMVEHDLSSYEHGGIAVLVDEKRDVKVTGPESGAKADDQED